MLELTVAIEDVCKRSIILEPFHKDPYGEILRETLISPAIQVNNRNTTT